LIQPKAGPTEIATTSSIPAMKLPAA